MSQWFVYIVRCSDNSLYTGVATDVSRRLTEHNEGRGAKYTRSRRPVTLVYQEQVPDRPGALRREHAIKKLRLAQKLELIGSGQT